MRQCDLFKKREGTAFIRTVIDETDTMNTIRAHDGYITDPDRGRQRTPGVGFDCEETAGDALADLEPNNEFAVESRESFELSELVDALETPD